MAKLSLEGSITLEGQNHSVEYEPGAMTGLSTLYIRVKGNKSCVPVYVNHIDELIDMLERGRAVIESLEG